METEFIKVKDNYHLALKQAITNLENGNIIAFPTDTVYGLGVNIDNIESIEKLYQIKNRPKNKPFAIYLYDYKQVSDYCENIPDIFYQLADEFLPGPLTIILRKKDYVLKNISDDSRSLAVRIPNNKFMLDLIKINKSIIVGTSANHSGEKSAIDAMQILRDFKNKISLILDGGTPKYSKESTVISLIDNKLEIIRNGALEKKLLEKVFYF